MRSRPGWFITWQIAPGYYSRNSVPVFSVMMPVLEVINRENHGMLESTERQRDQGLPCLPMAVLVAQSGRAKEVDAILVTKSTVAGKPNSARPLSGG